MDVNGKIIKHAGRYRRAHVVGSVVRLVEFGAFVAEATIPEAEAGRAAYLAEMEAADWWTIDAEEAHRQAITKEAI